MRTSAPGSRSVVASNIRPKAISNELRVFEAYCPICRETRGLKTDHGRGLIVKRCIGCYRDSIKNRWVVKYKGGGYVPFLFVCVKCGDASIISRSRFFRKQSMLCKPCASRHQLACRRPTRYVIRRCASCSVPQVLIPSHAASSPYRFCLACWHDHQRVCRGGEALGTRLLAASLSKRGYLPVGSEPRFDSRGRPLRFARALDARG
jgi:hypothetical protein